MLKQYIATIKNLREDTIREVSVQGTDPMYAHKEVFMKISSAEEIEEMTDNTGNTVFQLKRGFVRSK